MTISEKPGCSHYTHMYGRLVEMEVFCFMAQEMRILVFSYSYLFLPLSILGEGGGLSVGGIPKIRGVSISPSRDLD